LRLKRFSFSRPGAGPEPPEVVALDQSQSHQAITVLRLKVGVEVELIGPWGLAKAVAARIDLKPWPTLWVKLTSPFSAPNQAPGPLLGLALIKAPRFDWAVEKATELGASALAPLITHRSNPLAAGEAKRARWIRLSEEARKQCGRPSPMKIFSPLALAEWLAGSLPTRRYLAEAQGQPLKGQSLEGQPLESLPPESLPGESAVVLIGPEGGLTDAEKELAGGAGFKPLSLGPLTLRSETAALTALALLRLSPVPI
jgi:16S rRNA (uracil1498-N3)-methyltransferase